jgi:gibberellin 2-oxidase
VGVKEVCCEVLELIADGLGIKPRNVFSKMVRDEKSDSCLRVNHYAACGELQALSGGNLIGFGEHTDPQIISVLRSNNISGLQICLRDGSSWFSIPPDHTSFFISVGDSLQVTNTYSNSLHSKIYRIRTFDTFLDV